MPKPSPFGLRLRALRDKAGLTQEQLAKLANCANTEVSNYESGSRQSCSVGTVIRLARALNTTTDDLLGANNA